MAGDRGRRAHPDPRPHGVGQDARRVPVGDRPARHGSGSREDANGRGSSTSRRSRPSRSTWRRTSGRRSRGSGRAAERRGETLHTPTVGIRTGDTPAKERTALRRHPPDILITTPESLYLMLTSGARETLRDVRWVIVDEIHAIAGTKRGAHLALSLERLDAIAQAATAAHRPLGHATPAGRDRAVPRWPHRRRPASGHRRRRRRRARSSTSRSSSRSRTWARSVPASRRRRARPSTARPDRASGPTCIRGSSSRSATTAPP